MSTREHRQGAHGEQGAREVSWHRPHPERWLRFIEQEGLPAGAAILGVGGGACTLVDDLLARGFRNVTVHFLPEVSSAE